MAFDNGKKSLVYVFRICESRNNISSLSVSNRLPEHRKAFVNLPYRRRVDEGPNNLTSRAASSSKSGFLEGNHALAIS